MDTWKPTGGARQSLANFASQLQTLLNSLSLPLCISTSEFWSFHASLSCSIDLSIYLSVDRFAYGDALMGDGVSFSRLIDCWAGSSLPSRMMRRGNIGWLLSVKWDCSDGFGCRESSPEESKQAAAAAYASMRTRARTRSRSCCHSCCCPSTRMFQMEWQILSAMAILSATLSKWVPLFWSCPVEGSLCFDQNCRSASSKSLILVFVITFLVNSNYVSWKKKTKYKEFLVPLLLNLNESACLRLSEVAMTNNRLFCTVILKQSNVFSGKKNAIVLQSCLVIIAFIIILFGT